ncbi:MAG: COX15/CtaA family protein [Verrucomicrobiales bacterium]
MNQGRSEGRAFRHFTKVVAFFAVLLIWWGAATTTKMAGMAFADWPLSLGSINPDGWLRHMVPFLEHSHRLLATWVGVLVLVLFGWVYVDSGKRAFELLGLVVALAIVFGVFVAAGAERVDVVRKNRLLLAGTVLAFLPTAWLVWSWRWRSWRLIEKLSALALLLVTIQAILGGLRVTEISNTFAVIHGCLAQVFFCLLILIVMAAGTKWGDNGLAGRSSLIRFARFSGIVLVAMTSLQLIVGASMRHFHRHGLADTGILKTRGEWIPPLDEPIVALMFFHKFTAVCLLVAALAMWLRCVRHRGDGDGRAVGHLAVVLGLLLCQALLGMTVIATEKDFWVTNFHVLNGLAILAVSFVFLVKAWRGRAAEPPFAKS